MHRPGNMPVRNTPKQRTHPTEHPVPVAKTPDEILFTAQQARNTAQNPTQKHPRKRSLRAPPSLLASASVQFPSYFHTFHNLPHLSTQIIRLTPLHSRRNKRILQNNGGEIFQQKRADKG
jgi:hypothetical protein